MTCTHTVIRSVPYFDYTLMEHEGDIADNCYVDEPQGTYEDIDLHRFKCTQCQKVFYYSQSAHDHYELGIPSIWIND